MLAVFVARWLWFVGLSFSSLIAILVEASNSVNRYPGLRTPPDYNALPEGSSQSFSKMLGRITGFLQSGPNSFSIECGGDKLRIQFYRSDVVRVWLAWNGSFTDPASADIVVAQPDMQLQATWQDGGDYYDLRAINAHGVTLRLAKDPLKMSMYRESELLWSEHSPLTLNDTATFQSLVAADREFFFGGGMQNGRWSHKGQKIRISIDYNWDDGGNPNAAPFYLSTAGFGVYRNTWAPGYYDFTSSPSVLAHNESRFDAFYFAGDFGEVIEGYTFITGRPFMPPIYALGVGDSDCYHNTRHGNDTRSAIVVAEHYEQFDIPSAWMLINDGYGCGFGVGPTDFPSDFDLLDEVVVGLKAFDIVTGLWSSTGLPNMSREVNGSGIRVAKTDVGWIGGGYKFAFDAVREVVAGIEENSDARRFVWTVEGWAGTQRLAVMWTGDNAGSFEYIRWQIPTFVGSGFSAQVHVSGDVDGIFGGSPETYVRDLQFKCFTTTVMSMSGWAANPDKQPWSWGEPYTSINRMFLKIKQSLTPYFYSLSRVAHDTGFPIIRALALEFPNDNRTLEVNIGTTYSFMSGPSFLVAPVYKPLSVTGVRDGIYLPPGDWVDYWSGEIESGSKTIDGYPVPLTKLPVFVRAGAIIPKRSDMPGASRALSVYPSGNSSFLLYEDDGITREALERGQFSWTHLSCSAPEHFLRTGGQVTITLGASTGTYDGEPTQRSYRIHVHMKGPSPKAVTLKGVGGSQPLPTAHSEDDLNFKGKGYFLNQNIQGGVLDILTGYLPSSEEFQIHLDTDVIHDGVVTFVI